MAPCRSNLIDHSSRLFDIRTPPATSLFGAEQIWNHPQNTQKQTHTQIWAPAIAIADGGKALHCS